MVIKKNIFKTVLGILLGVLALYLGRIFWIYFLFSFGTIFSILVIPVMIGYVYMSIELIRFKKWAREMFFPIIVSAILIALLLGIMIGGPKIGKDIIEWFSIMIFWVSLVVIPVFGISALIRRMRKR